MHVYHLVARNNVDGDGWIIDPLAVRHGTLAHGQVDALAGPIDPLTHLNLDFTEHRLESCVIVAALQDGAIVQFTDTGFAVAYPQPSAFAARGWVDQAVRRSAWQANVQIQHEATTDTRNSQPTLGGEQRGDANAVGQWGMQDQ